MLCGCIPVITPVPALLEVAGEHAIVADSEHPESAIRAKIFPIMASGIPVLFSGRGEGADIVKEAGAGIVVEPGNPLALAQAVIDILEHPERASTMGARGRTAVTEHFSWDALVDNGLDQLRDRADVTSPHRLRSH
jgi:glycosyltransferase involved in cell wall biosynthesis